MIALGIGFGFSFSGPADRRRHLRHSARFRRRRWNLSDIPSVVSQGPIRSFFFYYFGSQTLNEKDERSRLVGVSRVWLFIRTVHPISDQFDEMLSNVTGFYRVLLAFRLWCVKKLLLKVFFSHFFLDQKDREKRSRTLILQKKLIFCT